MSLQREAKKEKAKGKKKRERAAMVKTAIAYGE